MDEVIDLAKRKLEKERELYMSKSLPGIGQDTNQTSIENESDSESDSDESDEKGRVPVASPTIVIFFLTQFFFRLNFSVARRPQRHQRGH